EKEEKIAEQLSPKIVTAAVPTKFIVFISSEKNKSLFNFEWDFGDNSPKETTNINKVEHVYNSIGNYSIKVKVFEGRVEKDVSEFKITVHAPIKAINETLKEYKERIRNFKTKKSSLPQNYIGPLNRTINIEEVESKVNKIENDYKSLLSSREQSEQTFIAIMDELSKEIEVPWDLKPSSISNINFIYELNDINLNNFKELFQANYNESMEEEYKNEIFSWFIENIETNINHKTYSVYFDEVNEPFVSEFEISIIPKKSLQGKGYLVIERDYNDISFKEEYNISKGTGITGIEIDLSKRNDIRFSISENINVFSLPLFISPEFSKLDLSQPALTKKKGWGFWTKFSIGFTIVMIIFLVIYILLQEWYKRNYESYLFKNKNDLYNLIYFIKNAKSRKLSNEQIKANLSKAKWKSEQINYAINKFEGKRIGMWEIPIFRKSERKKIEIEMMKRQNFVRI
ncbi:MAG: PKD domain-containing protein, partial [Candidatus Pacearchaeota archaeon]